RGQVLPVIEIGVEHRAVVLAAGDERRDLPAEEEIVRVFRVQADRAAVRGAEGRQEQQEQRGWSGRASRDGSHGRASSDRQGAARLHLSRAGRRSRAAPTANSGCARCSWRGYAINGAAVQRGVERTSGSKAASQD